MATIMHVDPEVLVGLAGMLARPAVSALDAGATGRSVLVFAPLNALASRLVSPCATLALC
jgi:hypothetical protein